MKVTQADGTEIEVPTPEETKVLQDQVAAAATLQQQLTDKEKTWNEEKTRLEQEVNPNWKALRDKEKGWETEKADLTKRLAEAGGKPPEAQVPLLKDDVEKIATAASKRIAAENHRDTLLSQFDTETKKVVEHYFTQLSKGEELTIAKVQETIEAAARAAGAPLKQTKRASFGITGSPPSFDDATLTEGAKELASVMRNSEKDLQQGGSVASSLLTKK